MRDNEKPPTRGAFFVVDPSLKTWNLFFKIVFEWAPLLRKVYEASQDAREPPVIS